MLSNFKKLMADIRPAQSGRLVNIEAEINLRNVSPDKNPESALEAKQTENSSQELKATDEKPFDKLLEDISKEQMGSPNEQLSAVMNRLDDPRIELASIGIQIKDLKPNPGLRPKNNLKKDPVNDEDDLHKKIIDKIREPYGVAAIPTLQRPATPVSFKKENVIISEKVVPDIEAKVASFYTKTYPVESLNLGQVKPKPINFAKKKKNFFSNLWLVGLVIFGLVAYGFTIKRELIHEGTLALNNFEEAQKNLKSFNFSEAAHSFQKSYKEFSQASQNLNFIGAGLLGIIGDVPGTGKIRSAKDIAEAGKSLASAGQAMAEALDSLSKMGGILDPADVNKTKPVKIIRQIKDALVLSDKSIKKAKTLVANIDESIIPEEKREAFFDFKEKIPLFEESIEDSIEYSNFLEGVIGIDESKKYLFLFQNNSELRPTGGFPGTYGIVSFSKGGLDNFSVDDVYNIDGQLKRNVIPPRQMQHITPTWAMRDASWFSDFPTSSKKVMEFFRQEAGYDVDGVITVNPDIVSNILKVVGPIKMPNYDMELTADNFLANIQEEVEYGPNRAQPKKIVSDFAPYFLEKLYSADSEKWMKIFDVLVAGLDQKDILLYFNDKELESFAVKKGFGGEIKKTEGDYLMINFSNIKGSKTDAVTDSAVSIENRLSGNKILRKIIISRDHNGGSREHGFYNKQNPAYVRVLVPHNAELIRVSGNNQPNFRPLVNYSVLGFEKDSDLAKFEAGFSNTNGVDEFREADKKVFGFWMITDPGTTKNVELEYSVPLLSDEYNFYFQKQPGLDWSNFRFTLNTNGKDIVDNFPKLNRIGNSYIFEDKVIKDFDLKIKLK